MNADNIDGDTLHHALGLQPFGARQELGSNSNNKKKMEAAARIAQWKCQARRHAERKVNESWGSKISPELFFSTEIHVLQVLACSYNAMYCSRVVEVVMCNLRNLGDARASQTLRRDTY